MEEPSKTKQKKNAKALQEIGVELVALPEKELEALTIPDILKNAVLEAQSITKHGARRRQLQYIGALMRDIDPEPVLAAVEEIKTHRDQAARRFREMETWRDQLISPAPDAPHSRETFMTTFPHADRQRLGQLIRNAANAKDEKKKTKAARVLFRYIREIMESADAESGF